MICRYVLPFCACDSIFLKGLEIHLYLKSELISVRGKGLLYSDVAKEDTSGCRVNDRGLGGCPLRGQACPEAEEPAVLTRSDGQRRLVRPLAHDIRGHHPLGVLGSGLLRSVGFF